MNFKDYRNLMQQHIDKMTASSNQLFEVDVDKDEMWELYLDSFNPEFNKIFRERRTHDCSSCRRFIKNVGNMVTIKDNKVTTIWDFNTNDEEYQPVIEAMRNYINSKSVTDVFVTKENRIGTKSNKEMLESGESGQVITWVITWEHLYTDIPKSHRNLTVKSAGDIKGSKRDVRNVFKRSLEEITPEAVTTVLELISSNTLYKGQEWKSQLNEFRKLQKEYFKLETQNEKENYTWEQSIIVGAVIGKIKNHSIGVLLTNISEGMDLETAVKKYEAIVAPSNYKRPNAIFTKKMLEDAQKTVAELGYMDSLKRRYATLDDITVNNILFTNKDSAKRIDGVDDIFGEMAKEVAVNPKKFSKVEEISADRFLSEVLPMAKELELFLENKHSSNMVSLIAPEVKDSKTMFKWNNNFGWAYSGNITDSEIKQQVMAKGGRVDGVLRMSSSWNHDGKRNQSLMDFHVLFPTNNQKTVIKNGVEVHDNYGNINRVGWNHRVNHSTGGSQDVDYTNPAPTGYVPVENITFPSLNKMPEGIYTFKAHNWNFRSSGNGFKCEIEFGGEVLEFDYNKPMKHKEWVTIAKIELRNGQWKVIESLPSSTSTKEVWGVHSQQFVPVSVVMNSPNYWDEQKGIGHRHVFFMLKNCINDETPNGFYNEFLKQDLAKHKRVFEALGARMAVKDVEDQLSGVGFSTTKRAEVIVKVTGQTERVMKIKF